MTIIALLVAEVVRYFFIWIRKWHALLVQGAIAFDYISRVGVQIDLPHANVPLVRQQLDSFDEFVQKMAEIHQRHRVNMLNVSIRHADEDAVHPGAQSLQFAIDPRDAHCGDGPEKRDLRNAERGRCTTTGFADNR